MAKLIDYAEHPEKITEQEWEKFNSMLKTTKGFGQKLEAFHFRIDSDNTPDKLASNFYQEHLIMAAILEAFFNSNIISYKELNQAMLNYVPKDDIPYFVFTNTIKKMIQLGMIKPIETDNKHMPKFEITQDGILAMQQQTFQTLASSTFYNFQTQKLNEQSMQLNERSIRMNHRMLTITIMSVIATIISVIVTILLAIRGN